MRLLLVDDSPEIHALIQRVFPHTCPGGSFNGLFNGDEAIEYLSAKGKFCDRALHPFPTVLLLDLKMPVLDGFDVLEWLQQNERCRVTPTILFSSSSSAGDVERAYILGATAFMTKPSSFNEMTRKLDAICRFWSDCEVPINSHHFAYK